MSGWIKIHRKLNEHWIWENSDYLKWWIDILMEANHTETKTLIKGNVFICKRGDKLYSIQTWAKRWKTNKSKANRFLNMLEKDEMIVLKNETLTTRLTICNYESYQDERNASETQVKRRRNASETQTKSIQECKNEKNDKNENVYREFKHLKISNEDYNKLLIDYTKKQVDDVLDRIENYNNNKNYTSLYLTSKNWLKKEPKKDFTQSNKMVY